jgi:serine/threonine protein kinase
VSKLSDSQITRYLLGQLSETEREVVERELDTSPELVQRMDAIRAQDDLTRLVAEAAAGAGAVDVAFSESTRPAPDDPSAFLAAPLTDAGAFSTPGGTQTAGAPTPPEWLKNHPRYEVLQLLGVGGMGRVWLARHRVMGRLVALKTLRAGTLRHPHAVDRFLREVQAAAKLNHPNIAAAYDAEQIEDVCLLAMEFVPGRTLASLAREAPLSVIDACRAIRDVAGGLAHAHAAGLVHRDIKPGNLVRTPTGSVKLLDFGLVVISDSDSSITGDNLVIGTPDYIAPEQAVDPRTADARSDLYSLGCTLYCLLNGRPPFAEASPVRKIDLHRTGTVSRPGHIPDGLWSLIERLMQKDPAHRFQSANELLVALEPWCRDPASAAPAPPVALPRAPRRWLLFTAGAGLATLLATNWRRWLHSNPSSQSGGVLPHPDDDPDNRSANTTADDATGGVATWSLKDLSISVDSDTPADSWGWNNDVLTLRTATGGEQTWLNFPNPTGTDLQLSGRLKFSTNGAKPVLKFAFLTASDEVNVLLAHDAGQRRRIEVELWNPSLTKIARQDLDDSFASDWLPFVIRASADKLTATFDGQELLSTPLSDNRKRWVAISARESYVDLDQLTLTRFQ